MQLIVESNPIETANAYIALKRKIREKASFHLEIDSTGEK